MYLCFISHKTYMYYLIQWYTVKNILSQFIFCDCTQNRSPMRFIKKLRNSSENSVVEGFNFLHCMRCNQPFPQSSWDYTPI